MSGYLENKTINMNFESLFKPLNICLRLTRCHPEIRKNWPWARQLVLMFTAYSFIFCLLVYSIIYQDLRNNDVTQACANSVLCFVYCIVTFNYMILFWYDNNFKDMITKIKTDYEQAESLSGDEFNILFDYAQKGQKVIKIWILISVLVGSVFPVKSIGLMIYYTVTGEFRLVHLYDLTYPSFVEEVKDELPVFLALYGIFLYYDLYSMAMYTGFSPLGPIFMLHACGQLKLANTRITKIFKESKDSNEIIRRLKDIARLINDIYSFVNRIKVSFKVLYELTLKVIIITLPITIYQVLESFHKGQIRIEFITIIFGCVILVSIPCYYSDMLMESGENLRLAVYSCGWEAHWDKKCRIYILLLLQRTSKSVSIQTMFQDLCLGALSDVFHHAYAIFNVLNAVWK